MTTWTRTSRTVISSSLTLPSLAQGPSIPLFARLSLQGTTNGASARPSPLDYIVPNAEQTLRQATLNNQVRELMRHAPKLSVALQHEAAPDSITLQSASPTASPCSPLSSSSEIDEPVGSLHAENSAEKRQSNATMHLDSVDMPADEENETLPSRKRRRGSRDKTTTQPRSTMFPAHRCEVTSPPWMEFLGQGVPSKESEGAVAPTKTWKEALQLMNEELDFFGRLHEEICALLLWLEPTPEELLLRQRVLARVTLVVQALWPNSEVCSFGSFYTGLWLPNGDMDICIMNVPGDQVANLRVLTVCLTRLGIPLAVEIIASARVPIVKFVDSETGVPVDISLNTDSALSTSKYVAEQMNIYPWLRPLVLVLKLYLQQRGLGETYRGGVGSYLLFVLCLSFLQQHKLLTSPTLMTSIGLGHLLLDFFQLYGRDFNIDTTGISVANGGYYFSKVSHAVSAGSCHAAVVLIVGKRDDDQLSASEDKTRVATRSDWFLTEKPSLLAVESPLAPHLDLGRNSYDIRTVRNCFRQSFLVLSEILYDWDETHRFDKTQSILKHVIFTNDPLMTRRCRHPGRRTELENTEWWKDVSGLFNLPVAGKRPAPTLPKSVLRQVARDLEAAGHSVMACVQDVNARVRGIGRKKFHQHPSDHRRKKASSVLVVDAPATPFAFNPDVPIMDAGTAAYKQRARTQAAKKSQQQQRHLTAVAEASDTLALSATPQATTSTGVISLASAHSIRGVETLEGRGTAAVEAWDD